MNQLKKLIQINSVTGIEAGIQDFILNLLTSYGLNPVKVKGNIIVLIKGIDSTKCLIFNAHTDTVGAGNTKDWKHGPFSGFESGGKVYGLGAGDNKASVAVLLELAKEFSHKKPECDLILAFTVGEEVDGHGTNDTVKWLATRYLKMYKKISAIVCEPTGLTCIGLAHKGNLFLKVTTKGESGHGSKPVKIHSVLKMYKIISKLENLSKKWKKKYKNPVLGYPTIGLATSISAGDSKTPNKFPEICTATFDIRTVPEMHKSAFKQIKAEIGKSGKLEYLYPPVLFAYTAKNSDVAQVLKKVTKVKFVAFHGSSDMPFFTQIGIPTVIFGPGEMNVIHKANEYCYLLKIRKCVDVFTEVVKRI